MSPYDTVPQTVGVHSITIFQHVQIAAYHQHLWLSQFRGRPQPLSTKYQCGHYRVSSITSDGVFFLLVSLSDYQLLHLEFIHSEYLLDSFAVHEACPNHFQNCKFFNYGQRILKTERILDGTLLIIHDCHT